MTTVRQIPAVPYDWPHDGDLRPETTALIVIDMQHDFCGCGGYVEAMGYDIAPAREIVPRIAALAEHVRRWGGTVVLTREGHRADLSDLSPFKLWRSRNGGAAIGAQGPMGRLLVRGEPGWDFIPELAPEPGDVVIDKSGYSAFQGTDLELVFRVRGVRKLILVGVTTDVCVHSTLRDATDRGYECLVVGDACAATEVANHRAALATITTEGGIFGAVAQSPNIVFDVSPGR
ncbi:MAG: cysteine hydrolase [Rhodobacteraceae bacterium]|nr:cysteine hydrolase [Paracoccaceae bacterium]